jgi:hypothetical protein
MVESAGKSRKNVDAYVLLPPDAKRAVDLLINSRARVGVPETNEFIFARFSVNSPMSGNNELREVVQPCPSLKSPDRITSTNLRKYIATVSQVICRFLFSDYIHGYDRVSFQNRTGTFMLLTPGRCLHQCINV